MITTVRLVISITSHSYLLKPVYGNANEFCPCIKYKSLQDKLSVQPVLMFYGIPYNELNKIFDMCSFYACTSVRIFTFLKIIL